MMQCLQAFFGLVIFKHGKARHPNKLKFILVDHTQFRGDMIPEITQGLVDHLGLIGHKEDQITGLHFDAFGQRFFFFVGEKFGNG